MSLIRKLVVPLVVVAALAIPASAGAATYQFHYGMLYAYSSDNTHDGWVYRSNLGLANKTAGSLFRLKYKNEPGGGIYSEGYSNYTGFTVPYSNTGWPNYRTIGFCENASPGNDTDISCWAIQ